MFFLHLAVEAAKSVVHIRVAESDSSFSCGTGFMVSPRHLMTNNHVLCDKQQAENAEYTFNYQLDADGTPAEVVKAKACPEQFFHTNAELDYTVVCLEEVPDAFSPLQLNRKGIQKNNRVSIIQHPGGYVKQISMQNNFVAYADNKVVQYTTSTQPGSSGSPVFNDNFDVVAIHRSGGLLAEPGSSTKYMRNEGTSMYAVTEDLKSRDNFIHQLQLLK